jgi:hypothetical protein
MGPRRPPVSFQPQSLAAASIRSSLAGDFGRASNREIPGFLVVACIIGAADLDLKGPGTGGGLDLLPICTR